MGEEGEILGIKRIASYQNRPQEAKADVIELCRALVEENFPGSGAVESIGICAPGITPEGKLSWPGWEDVCLGKALEEAFGCPVQTESRAGAMLLAEAVFGAAQGDSSVILIRLDTGEGAAILADDRLGESGCVPQQLTVISEQNNGWKDWESAASLKVLAQWAQKRAKENPLSLLGKMEAVQGVLTADQVLEAMAEKDPEAAAMVDRYLDGAAAGIAGLVPVFQPQRILLGGSRRGDLLVSALCKRVEELLAGRCAVLPPIGWGELGEKGTLIGAAFLERYRAGSRKG